MKKTIILLIFISIFYIFASNAMAKTIEIPKEVEVFHDVSSFLEKYKDYEDDIFDIGGASLYKELLEYADSLYLTEIDDSFDADVYFPYFKREDYDRKELCCHEENGIGFKHVLYKRR